MMRHRPDWAHTVPGNTYGQDMRAATRGEASSAKYLFSRASPASRRPHLGLQHIPWSPWLATGGIFGGATGARPLGTRLQVEPSQFRLLRREAAFSVRLPISLNKLLMEIVNSPTLDTFKGVVDLAWISLFPSLDPKLPQFLFCMVWGALQCRCTWPIHLIWFDTSPL